MYGVEVVVVGWRQDPHLSVPDPDNLITEST